MNALRTEIEKRIVDVWSKDVADDNDRHESGRLEDEFRAFMDGVVAAAAVCPDAPEDLRRIAEAWNARDVGFVESRRKEVYLFCHIFQFMMFPFRPRLA